MVLSSERYRTQTTTLMVVIVMRGCVEDDPLDLDRRETGWIHPPPHPPPWAQRGLGYCPADAAKAFVVYSAP